MLATISGTPLRSRLARAWATSSWLSAAKPTQYGGAGSRATAARMSGFSAIASVGAALPCAFLSLCTTTSAGRQSATAAVATKTSCAAASGSTASCICCAVCTSMRRTPGGVASATGPATRVTAAPASAAARAMAKPILPLERLVMPRTGSIGS